MRKLQVFTLVIILISMPFIARDGKAGEYHGTESPFVVGASGRGASMGLACTGFRGDASIQWANPAAMIYLEWKELVFFRTVLFDSKSLYHAIGYTHPLLNYGTIGINVLRLDVGGIEERDIYNQLLSSDLHNAHTRMLLGYAAGLSRNIAAGFNLKVDHQTFGSSSGTGVGLDLGMTASTQTTGDSYFRSLTAGFVIQNLIEPKIKLVEEGVPDPMQLAVGTSIELAFRDAFLTTSIDLVKPRYSPFNFRVGQEISYLNYVSLRFGLDHDTPTYGMGVRFKNISFDYAYRSEEIDNNHRFSLSVKFGASTTEKKRKARIALEQDVNNTINSRMRDFEQQQLTSELHKGDSLFTEDNFDEAIRRYEMALLWDPYNEHAEQKRTQSQFLRYKQLGENALNNEDYVQAVLYLRQALDYAPGDPAVRSMVKYCDEQIATSQRVVEFTQSLLKKAIDLYDDRSYSQALAGFIEVLSIDPSNQLAFEFKERCLVNIDKAIKHHRQQARILADKGDFEAAIRELQAVLQYRPSDKRITSEINALQIKQEQLERELAMRGEQAKRQAETQREKPAMSAEQLRELNKKYDRAMNSFNAGDFDDAIKKFQEVWTVDPEFHNVSEILAKAYLFKGMKLYSEERYNAAATVWKQALNIDPDNDKVKRYLVKISEELKKVPEAISDEG